MNRNCSQQWPKVDCSVHYICSCVALITFCRNMNFADEPGCCTDGVDVPCLRHMQSSRLSESVGEPNDWIGVSQYIDARLLDSKL